MVYHDDKAGLLKGHSIHPFQLKCIQCHRTKSFNLSHMQSSKCFACLITLMRTVQLLRAGTSFTNGSTAGCIQKQKTEVDSKMLCGMRLILIVGLVTELGDSKCPEFPLKLLGMKAARRSRSPRPLTRSLLMPLVSALGRHLATSAVQLC